MWFTRYTEVFDTVEINNTFYRMPETAVFESWRRQAPDEFLYALKFSRYGSHLKRLREPEDTIGAFVERAAQLGPHLGPILVQLPPRWRADRDRLDAFLAAAPRRLRWAVEFRDADWLRNDVFEILRAHRAALCIHDLVTDHPVEVTTEWVYLRFHGEGYGRSYSHQFLTARAAQIANWLKRGLDVYAYFNNDLDGHAVRNAQALRRYLQTRVDRPT